MDIKKQQRAVVDALEDIKAQDIQVFNTEGLTSLFDRVVIATASSNRQTRALANSVQDKARELGIQVIATEGQETGEWVLVDLGDVVVHIMQPAIREYYNLEEIWGGKPVRMTLDAPTTLAKASEETPTKGTKKTAKTTVKKTTAKAATKKTVAKKVAAKKVAAKKAPAKKTVAAKTTAKKPVASKTAAKTAAKTATKAATKTAAKAITKAATKTATKAATKAATKTATKTVKKAATKTASKTTTKRAAKKAAP